MATGKPFQHIFISYAREDQAKAVKIDGLLRSIGLDVWLDAKRLMPGYTWNDKIEEAIDRATGAIILVSEHSLCKEGYIQKEIDLLLKRQEFIGPKNAFVIPVVIGNCDFNNSRLGHLQVVDFREPVAGKVGKFLSTFEALFPHLVESAFKVADMKREAARFPDATHAAAYTLAKGTKRKLFEPDEMNIYGDRKTKEVTFFHGKQIDTRIRRLRYVWRDHSVVVEMESGEKLDLGVKIQWLLRPLVTGSRQIQIVRTADGHAIDGVTVPIKVPLRAGSGSLGHILWVLKSLVRGNYRPGRNDDEPPDQ